ncbi:methyltransferase-like protein 27 [Ischnura elegans]|uniref:methyltransferase-like protein 27 n=1 Tax=Ischnura elegans TaxID=197161 RepID=UPI001ED899E4|nr:methyltransferase-like protein 27 [Ischnura elegans]
MNRENDDYKAVEESVGKVLVEGLTPDQLAKVYDDWADTYDKELPQERYYPEFAAEALGEVYEETNKAAIKDARVLDVAAGTGRLGEALRKYGFRHIDALEPSEKMLEKLKARGIYGKTWKDTIGIHQTPIEDNAYDAVMTAGAFLDGHMPVNAVHEMVRIVRPGGYISTVVREDYLTNAKEISKLEPLFDKLEAEKKIKRILRRVSPKYYLDHNGVVFLYKVL